MLDNKLMSENSQNSRIEAMYDAEASVYADTKEESFSWQYIERPAFDRYLTDGYLPDLVNLYTPDTTVLDLGCGAGLVAQHLASRGIDPSNITGIDLSGDLISVAKTRVPEAHFIHGSIDDFHLPADSFRLVTANMVLHYLNNEQLSRTLELVYDVLEPTGTFFFVDADPDYSEETRRPENVNKWMELPTPWGGSAPWFSRSPHELLLDMTYFAGFDVAAGFPLPVSEEGKSASPAQYQKYTSYPARMPARLDKVPEAEKQRRLEAKDREIPSLI
jgi:ubiquinone/menaquinone biosynthesis C-methylase UbiE